MHGKYLGWSAVGLLLATICSAAQTASRDNDDLERARQLAAAHDWQKANELVAGVLHDNPGNTDANLLLGDIRLGLRLNEDAMKSFESVLSLNPGSEPAREGEVKAAEAAALADRDAGLDGSALLCLIRARKFVPDSPHLLLDFGIQAERMKIYFDADTALAKALELAPEDPTILYALARVQLDEQKMADGERNLRAYLKLRPEDATAHYGLGHLLHLLLRDEEAKKELEQSIALQPHQTSSYYELGEIARESNRPDDAKRNYEKVIALAPHHGGALTGLGILAFRAGDLSTAETYLASAVSYAPDFVTAHHYYSLVLSRLGRNAEARREADLATSLSARDAKAYHGNQLTIVE